MSALRNGRSAMTLLGATAWGSGRHSWLSNTWMPLMPSIVTCNARFLPQVPVTMMLLAGHDRFKV